MRSPLVTQDYYFPVTQVVAEANFPNDSDINAIAYDIKTGVFKGKEEGQYQLNVEITSEHAPKEKGQLDAYRVHLVVIGHFEVSPEWPDPEKLVRINGASILYSAAREFLITITSRGPWGALMLPTISFNDSPPEDKDPDETSKKLTKKSNRDTKKTKK